MVQANRGDLVRMEYTGRTASTGMIFDTTSEEIARKAGIFEQSAIYGPKLALFGTNAIMRGMEEAIISSQLGKGEDFLIEPEKAFGARQPDLVRVLSEKEFAKNSVRPVPGMVITLDNALARVKSVTSGRVVVDFNHPLAGESVLYSLKVQEVISDDGKKIEAILSSLGVLADVSQNGSGRKVSFKADQAPEKLETAKRAILAVVTGTEFTGS